MTTTPTACTERPTGAGFARAVGFGACAPAAWFRFAGHTAGFTAVATAPALTHKATHKAIHTVAYKANTAIATYPHRQPGEDAPH